MNKSVFSTLVLAVLTFYSAVAQKDSFLPAKAFKQLSGCWQGTLQYSGTMIRKPYTTIATLIVHQIGTAAAYEFLHVYTQEQPAHKVADTIVIATDNSRLNNEKITEKHCMQGGNFVIITQSQGFDEDLNKAATIRQTYTIGKQRYIYKKEIQPDGQSAWFDRQEFIYERKACGSEK